MTPDPTHPAPDDGLYLPWRQREDWIEDSRREAIFDPTASTTPAQLGAT